jgi:ketosteroid isomerase-like protein
MSQSTHLIERFNSAFNAKDVHAVMQLMTSDVVFEGTVPPDGDPHVGAEAVRAEWERLFTGTRDLSFVSEEVVDAGDKVVVRWRFTWSNADGTSGHVRGIDLFTIRDGLIAEKLSYVKG